MVRVGRLLLPLLLSSCAAQTPPAEETRNPYVPPSRAIVHYRHQQVQVEDEVPPHWQRSYDVDRKIEIIQQELKRLYERPQQRPAPIKKPTSEQPDREKEVVR